MVVEGGKFYEGERPYGLQLFGFNLADRPPRAGVHCGPDRAFDLHDPRKDRCSCLILTLSLHLKCRSSRRATQNSKPDSCGASYPRSKDGQPRQRACSCVSCTSRQQCR